MFSKIPFQIKRSYNEKKLFLVVMYYTLLKVEGGDWSRAKWLQKRKCTEKSVKKYWRLAWEKEVNYKSESWAAKSCLTLTAMFPTSCWETKALCHPLSNFLYHRPSMDRYCTRVMGLTAQVIFPNAKSSGVCGVWKKVVTYRFVIFLNSVSKIWELIDHVYYWCEHKLYKA